MQLIAAAIIAALLIGLGSGMYIGGYWNEAGHSLETIKTQREEIKVEAAQYKVSTDSDREAVVVQDRIRTVFKDRIVYKEREVPVEVIKKMDSECVVSNHFVSLWNSANQAQVPNPAVRIDEAPSGVRLSDISSQKDVESEICLANTKQLIGLQGWINALDAIPLK